MKLYFSADLCSFFMWLLQFPFLCLRWIDRSDIFILLLCKASGIKRKWKKPFYDHKYLWRPLLKLHCFLSLSFSLGFLLVFPFSCSTSNSIRLSVILDLFCDKFLLKLYLRNHIPQFKSCTWISFWCNIVTLHRLYCRSCCFSLYFESWHNWRTWSKVHKWLVASRACWVSKKQTPLK